jgi:hypothetical protein
MLDARLLEAMASGNVVVVVGTGMSAALSGGAPTATWRGFLEDGVARLEAAEVDPNRLSLIRENIRFGFEEDDGMTVLLMGAGVLCDEVSRLGPVAYGKWLEEAIGGLPLKDSALKVALLDLPYPIVTTNFDTLLTTPNRRAVSWKEPSSAQAILVGKSQDILHLHGVWSSPDSVVISDASYRGLLASDAAMALERAASSLKTFVYIGFGSGLHDPNFSRLIAWQSETFAGSSVQHFRLCLDEDLDDLKRLHQFDHIEPISYGSSHSDLASFISSMVPVGTRLDLNEVGIARDPVTEAQEHFRSALIADSVLAESSDHSSDMAVGEALLPPVLLPVPQAEYVRSVRSREKELTVERLNPKEEVQGSDFLLVVGDENSGVTTAIKWLALEGAKFLVSAVPLIVSFRQCQRRSTRPLTEQIRNAARMAGISLGKTDRMPPYVLALDDFSPYVDRISDKVLEELSEGEPLLTILGCRQGTEDHVLERLARVGIRPRVRYLGRLNSSDVKDMARLASKSHYDRISSQVLDVVRRENLPRTPYTIALLISVLLRSGVVTPMASQAAILDDYIGLLLGRGDPHEDARLGLDQTGREEILSRLAEAFVKSGVGGLLESEVVDSFQATFDLLGWGEHPNDVLTSFMERRVLRRDGSHIVFARSSYLHFFVAKRAIHDQAFRDLLLEKPLYFSAALSNYAALSRRDGELLDAIRGLLEREEWDRTPGGVFDEIPEIEVPTLGPAGDDGDEGMEPDRDEERAASGVRRRDPLDTMGDEDYPAFPMSDESGFPPTIRLLRSLELVSTVLRDSDQVEDLELKREILVEVLTHWGIFMSVIGHDTAFKDLLMQMLEETDGLGTGFDPAKDDPEEFMRFLPAAIALGGVTVNLVSRKLSSVLRRAMADEQLRESDEGVVAASFFVYSLREKGWVTRLNELLEGRGNIWVVRNFFVWNLVNVYVSDAARGESEELLEMVLDIIQQSTKYDSERSRLRYRDSIKKQIEAAKTRSLTRKRLEEKSAPRQIDK